MMACSATRLVILLLVFELNNPVAGTCLSYGHSCWGGHGKRSDSGANIADNDTEDAQLLSDNGVPTMKNQWELRDLPDIQVLEQLNNDFTTDLMQELLLVEDQQSEDEVPDDLLPIANKKTRAPHKLALHRVLESSTECTIMLLCAAHCSNRPTVNLIEQYRGGRCILLSGGVSA